MGPRNCLGKKYVLVGSLSLFLSLSSITNANATGESSFAYLQIRVILCKLLWHFDLELAPQSAKWNEQNAHLLWEMKPLMVKLSHRKF